MSECTDVNKNLAKNAGMRWDFQRLVLLIEWHLRCLEKSIKESRNQFPETQEKILFKEIKNQAQTLKSDLIKLDIKNLKLFSIGLFDYEVGKNANFNKFLVQCLLSRCIAMSEEIPKIRTDGKVREPLNKWLQYISDAKANSKITFSLDDDIKAKIDRYLITRRDVESLNRIHYNIDTSKNIFEGNKIPLRERLLALQRTFHIAGEYLKDTQNTANLSSDVKQSLEKSGIPANRLSKYRDTLAHNQLYPLIETNDKQVKKLYDDFLIIKKGIKTKIMEMEYSFIEKIIEESKIRGPVVKELTQLIRQKGFQELEQRISKIKLRPEHRSQSDQSKLDYIFQNVRHLRSRAFRESLAEVSDGELSTTYVDSITNHISQSMLNLFDKLRNVVAPRLEGYVGNLQNLHDDVLNQQEVINLLRYKGTSPPNMSILDEFLSKPILKKVIMRNNRSLKEELARYFDAESFKTNNVYDAKFKDSDLKYLIGSLKNNIHKPDDKTRKLITFLESKKSNINIQDIPPEEYERLVEDLPINSYKIREMLLSYSVEWKKKKCVDLLEKNFPAIKAIYDNIVEGKLIDVSAYKELVRQYDLQRETEIQLKSRAETLNDNIKELYSKRLSEELDVLKKLKNVYAVESQIINVYSLYEMSELGRVSYEIRRFRNYLSHGDPLVSIEEHITKIANRIVNIIKGLMEKLNGLLSAPKITEILKGMDSSFGVTDIVELICPASQSGKPPLGRHPRHVSESCLTWEEIDKISEEEAENRDPDNIKINSEKFISRISSEDLEANEEKFSNLIALANESEVTGDHRSKVNMLIDNHRYFGHLEKVGKISGTVMETMIAKDMIGALVRGDYEDVANTLSILALGTGLQKVAELANVKGAGYILKSRALLGNFLKFAAPFLSRGVTAFIAWDLYNHLKTYTKGDTDALVTILGDSILVGVDIIEIGVEIGEVLTFWEGASAVSGPIGMAVGALVFVGTDIFRTVRTVTKIDEYINLTGWQEFTEGFRAFFGQGSSHDIEMLIDEKEANDQAVKHVLCFLNDNSHIRRYVFPSMKAYTIDEHSGESKDSGIIETILLSPSILEMAGAASKGIINMFSSPKLIGTRVVLNNTVLLDKRRYNIKWGRTRPSNVQRIDFFCLPMGDWESVRDGTTYYCDGAIGVEYTDFRNENNTVISIGDGDDQVMGFQDSSNIFNFGDGHKKMTGGNKNDKFIFEGKSVNATRDSEIKGSIDGRGGIDRIDVSQLTPYYEKSKGVGRYQVTADFRQGVVKDTSKVSLHIENINEFLGRKGGVDHVVFACDTKHVDGRGGENKNYLDSIIIPKDDACYYDTKVTVNPYTKVTNNATSGKFVYIVKGGKGKEAYIELDPSSQSNNMFVFDYALTDFAGINISQENIIFSFVEEFYKREKIIDVNSSFNVTVSGAPKNVTTYHLIDHTKIVIDRNNVYAMQNTEKPIVCLVKDYSSLADKSKVYVVVHSNDEVLVAGHSHADVVWNDHNARASHLVGGGGENIFYISSGHEKLTLTNLPISDVVIYDFDQEDKIDTLDLYEIKKQLKNDIDREINTVISKNCCDLLITLSLDDASKKEVVKIILKGALKNNWYKRVHVNIDNIFVIKEILGDFELTSQPLIFDDNSKTIYVINSTNVEKGGKIRVTKEIGNYIFARNNDALYITNHLGSSTDENNLFTVILDDFYRGNNRNKMQSLKIEFDDKTILLRNEIDRINSAGNFSELMRKVKIDRYKAVISAINEQKLFEAIEGNNIGEVKELIEHGVSIDARNNEGQTPLHIAALNGKLGIVKYLVDDKRADVNVNDNFAIKSSHCVVSGSGLDVIKYIVRNKLGDVNVKTNYGIKPLHYAAFGGNLDVVKYLIEKTYADAIVNGNYEITPLHYAAFGGNLEVVKYLVDEIHADVNVKDNYEITPLHYAALGGNLEVVKYLVEEKHADVNVKDNSQITLLHYAAFGSNLEVVKYLVEEEHADVNVKDNFGNTLLHYAASRSNLNVVKYLLEEKHADVNVKDDRFEVTPLYYAASGGNLEIVKYLVEYINVKDNSLTKYLLHSACGRASANVKRERTFGGILLNYAACDDNLGVIKYLIEEKHVGVNVKDNFGITLLHYAAARSSLKVVKYLVEEKHADVNLKDNSGNTLLQYAACDGNLEVVKYLLEQKHAGVNVKHSHGVTLLHLAASNGNLELVKYLVRKGDDVNLKDNFGAPPLHYAALDGNLEMVKYLIEKGAKIDIKINGRTPLDILEHKGYKREVDSIVKKLTERLLAAVIYDDFGEFQDLRDQGVSFNIQSDFKLTLLHYAAFKGKLKVLKYLIEQKHADVNVRDYSGLTPLHYAVDGGNLEVVKYLIEQKHADINVKQDNGDTPLRSAVTGGNLEIVKYLAGKGADVTQMDIDIATGNLEMVKYLTEIKGADLNVRTRFNRQTPLDIAVAGNYSNIVEHLETTLNVIRETPQQHERNHRHSSRSLLTTDSSNQTEIATSDTSEKSSWVNDLVGSIVKLEESSAPPETVSSNHPIRHERRKRYNDRSKHEDGMRIRMRHLRHRHRRVQKRDVKYQDSHYYIDQPEIAASSGTRPSSWINGLVDWIKEKGGRLVSSVADKFATKESEGSKSRGIHACSVRLEKVYSATMPNIPQSRKSQGVPKGNISNTSWSGRSSNREKVTSNVTDAPEMNTTVLNNALILGDLAVRLVNGTRYKQPIHENLLSPGEKSMRFIDENMIMGTIQQGKEKFGGLATSMDEAEDWNWEISG